MPPNGNDADERGDFAKALRVWRPLADQGLADAQFNLGRMYYLGQGVPQNYAEAAKWYRQVAAAPADITFTPIRLRGLDEQPAMLRLAGAEGKYAAIPLLKDAAVAGLPVGVNEHDIESWVIIYKDKRWLSHGPENYTCIRVRGKSMYLILDHGDIAAIDHSARPTDIEHLKRLNGKIVVFRVTGGVIIK